MHSPTISKEVYDVSGAGDTVLAVIASCFPNNIDKEKTLNLANKAAGKVIGKIGTSSISIKELFSMRYHIHDKIFDIKITYVKNLKR